MKVAFKHSEGKVVVLASVKEVVIYILSPDYTLADSSNREAVWAWLETRYTERFNQLEESKTMEELHNDRFLCDLALAWETV